MQVQKVKNGANGEGVGSQSELLAPEDLGGDVVGGAGDKPLLLHLLELAEVIREPEVDDLDVLDALALADLGTSGLEVLAVLHVLEHDHDVLGLEVPVHDLELVQVHDRLHDVADDEGALELVQEPALLDVLVQVLAVDVLGDDVLVRLRVDGVDVLEDLRVVQDLQDLALIAELQMGYLIISRAVLVSLSSSISFSAYTLLVALSIHL